MMEKALEADGRTFFTFESTDIKFWHGTGLWTKEKCSGPFELRF
jgi:hypothetical protein